jgi:enterochelin esterase-like enzyme
MRNETDGGWWPRVHAGTLVAKLRDGSVRLTPAPSPTPELCRDPGLSEEAIVHESFSYDARYHRPSSKAAVGECSQHGIDSCKETPVISFQDRNNKWQSGCQRALDELVARGEISPPALPG